MRAGVVRAGVGSWYRANEVLNYPGGITPPLYGGSGADGTDPGSPAHGRAGWNLTLRSTPLSALLSSIF